MEKMDRNPGNRSDRAFTLIELLVVVGIITILAAIAVPNFMEAQIRTKVSRMKNDMRAMTVALETYFVDNNHYPLRRHSSLINDAPFSAENLSFAGWFDMLGTHPALPEKSTTTDHHYQATQLAKLTTPIAYMGSLYQDLFSTHNRYPDNLIDYWDPLQTMFFINCSTRLLFLQPPDDSDRIYRPSQAGYLVMSVGPDTYIGTNYNTDQDGWINPPGNRNNPYWNSIYRPYDPTNGTVSAGNLYLGSQMGGLDGTGVNMTNRKLLPEDAQ